MHLLSLAQCTCVDREESVEAELRLAVAGSQRRRWEKNYCILSSSEAKKVSPFFYVPKCIASTCDLFYTALVRYIYSAQYEERELVTISVFSHFLGH